MSKIIALYSSKGGVGKTSACINLAWIAASEGKKVLLWDLDPQGASTFFLSHNEGLSVSAEKLVAGKREWHKQIVPTQFENISLIPADDALRHIDLLLHGEKGEKKLLSGWLESVCKREHYEYIFLDCPPGVSILTDNIFRAVDVIAVPVVPAPLSERSLEQVKVMIGEHKGKAGKLRPFFSLVDTRKNVHRSSIERLSSQEKMLTTQIPSLSEIEKMGVTFVPSASIKRSRSQSLFQSLWNEIKSE